MSKTHDLGCEFVARKFMTKFHFMTKNNFIEVKKSVVQLSTKVRFHDENIDLTTQNESCDNGHEFMQITYGLHDVGNEKFHDHS